MLQRIRRVDGRRPDDITAFKRTIALSGLSRLLQSRLGLWGKAVAAATDCASFASACCKRLWYSSKDSPYFCIMTKKVQDHHDILKIFHKNRPRSSTRAGGWAGGCQRCCSLLLCRPLIISRRRGGGGRSYTDFEARPQREPKASPNVRALGPLNSTSPQPDQQDTGPFRGPSALTFGLAFGSRCGRASKSV